MDTPIRLALRDGLADSPLWQETCFALSVLDDRRQKEGANEAVSDQYPAFMAGNPSFYVGLRDAESKPGLSRYFCCRHAGEQVLITRMPGIDVIARALIRLEGRLTASPRRSA